MFAGDLVRLLLLDSRGASYDSTRDLAGGVGSEVLASARVFRALQHHSVYSWPFDSCQNVENQVCAYIVLHADVEAVC